MKQIPVGDTFALVDDRDYERVMANGPWRLTTGGYAQHSYYRRNKSPKTTLMHRLILDLGPGDSQVDHVNHDKLDNQRENLRTCTCRQNHHNVIPQKTYAGKKKASRFKGVTLAQHGVWHASIRLKSDTVSLGTFEDAASAARAYDSAAAHFFGEFAFLNFPGETPAPYIPQQRQRDHTSPYPGVYYCGRPDRIKKWLARFNRHGKNIYLGMHLTESEAIAACETYLQEHGLPSRLPL